MKTVVYQSFRTTDVPDPIVRCLQTVEAWAGARGYTYRFIDDTLFDRVPAWFSAKVAGNRLPMSDLARLKVARELLDEGYDRTIWLDADVLVFAPRAFDITVTKGYAFGREVWVRRGDGRSFFVTEGVHNAICVFCRGNDFLDFYIRAGEDIVRGAKDDVLSHQIGPDFLTGLRDEIGGRIVPDVGLFSPLVITDVAKGGGPALDRHMAAFDHPVRAANLCLSFIGRPSSGVVVTEQSLASAIEKLLAEPGLVAGVRGGRSHSTG